MNKKSNRNLLVFATIILIISLVFTFAACKDKSSTDDEPNEPTPTLAAANVTDSVTNGSFYTTTGTAYPLTPGTWSATAAQTSGDYKTPSSTTDVAAGVVSLWEYSYNLNSGNWDGISNPGLQVDADAAADATWKYVPAENDYNVLMIYNKYVDSYSDYATSDGSEPAFMPKGTAYYYNHSSISLSAGYYYKLTVAVLTTGKDSTALSGDAKKGAYINLKAGSNSSFYSIETAGAWQTYTYYIKSNPSNATTATLTLGLGYGAANSGYMTQGYAFFDSVALSPVTAADYTAATESANVNKVDLTLINGDFDEALTIDTTADSLASVIPTGYTAVRSQYLVDDTATETSITGSYALYGTVDATKQDFIKSLFNSSANFTNYSEDLISASELNALARFGDESGKTSDSVLMILNKDTNSAYAQGNAVGVKTSNSIVVPIGKVVRISVDVFTKIINDDAATNAMRGVTLKLVNDNSDLELTTLVKNDSDNADDWSAINTNATWKTYSFYIVGSDYSSYEYTFYMYFGLGGRDEQAYHATGAAFFDNLTFEVLSDDQAANVRANVIDSDNAAVLTANKIIPGATMTTTLPTYTVNYVANGEFDAALDTAWSYGLAGTIDDSVNAVIGTEGVDYKAGIITKAQSNNVEYLQNTWKMSAESAAKVGVPYDSADQILAIALFNPSAYELKLKDDITVNKNAYYRLSMWIKTVDIPDDSGLTIALVGEDGTSLSSFTTVNTASYTHYLFNDYCQYNFYIEGDYLDASKVSIKITLGSGSRISTSSFTSGYVFCSSIIMTNVKAADYSGATAGTYIKKYSFTSTKGNVANGLFYIFDTADTEYDTVSGELTTEPGKVKSWTLVSDTADVEDKTTSGIVNINDATLMTALGIDADTVYNKWYSENDGVLSTGNAVIGDGKPTFLYIKSNEDGIKPVGYKYSVTLSSDSYYVFYVDVKTIGASKASIYLDTTNVVDSNTHFTNVSTREGSDDTWTRFCVGINVGMMSDVSMSISLYLGAAKTAPEGTVKDDDDYTAANAFIKSGDAVMFDNVRYLKLDNEDDYNAALAKFDDNYAAETTLNDEQAISFSDTFTTDGFETKGSVTSSTSPFPAVNSSNLSGSAAASAPSAYANVIMGVLSSDVEESALSDTGLYVTKVNPDTEESEDELISAPLSLADVGTLFADGTHGDSVVIICNRTATGYAYTMSKKYSLASKKYYEISIWVATAGITPESGKGAFVRLTAGSNSETQTYTAINPAKVNSALGDYSLSQWQKYTFYIKNNTASALSSAYLTFGLGEASAEGEAEDANYVQGIAFFDNITVRSISEEEYNVYAKDIPAVEADDQGVIAKRQGAEYDYTYNVATKSYEKVTSESAPEGVILGTAWILDYEPTATTDDTDDTEDNTTTTDDNKNNNANGTMDWEYFSYIAISLALVLAVVVVIIRRYAPKKKKTKETTATKPYSRNAVSPKDEKTSERMKDYKGHSDSSLLNKNKGKGKGKFSKK